MRKKMVWASISILVFVGVSLAYVYFALPLIWPVVYSDLRHFDFHGKIYYLAKLESLKKEAARLEELGKKNIAVNQIIHEAHWLCLSTRNFQRIAERLQALRRALDDPTLIGAADEQSAEDGSWGKWYTEWFFKTGCLLRADQHIGQRRQGPAISRTFSGSDQYA